MKITVENNQVIVNLDEFEFPLFEAMFQNLDRKLQCSCEFRDFDGNDFKTAIPFLPMHLCRTIGEANLSADPFATVSLYPFWKYGFAFGTGGQLSLGLNIDDPHKKAVAADEFGMGSAWPTADGSDQIIFPNDYDCCGSSRTSRWSVGFSWENSSTTEANREALSTNASGACRFEAKGTTGSVGDLTGALSDGKLQTAGIGATDPIKCRVAVGCAFGGGETRVVLLDPPGGDAEPTNITADLVRRAAKQMRASIRLAPTQPPEILPVGVVRE